MIANTFERFQFQRIWKARITPLFLKLFLRYFLKVSSFSHPQLLPKNFLPLLPILLRFPFVFPFLCNLSQFPRESVLPFRFTFPSTSIPRSPIHRPLDSRFKGATLTRLVLVLFRFHRFLRSVFALLFDQTARFSSVPFPFSQTIIIQASIDRPIDRETPQWPATGNRNADLVNRAAEIIRGIISAASLFLARLRSPLESYWGKRTSVTGNIA